MGHGAGRGTVRRGRGVTRDCAAAGEGRTDWWHFPVCGPSQQLQNSSTNSGGILQSCSYVISPLAPPGVAILLRVVEARRLAGKVRLAVAALRALIVEYAPRLCFYGGKKAHCELGPPHPEGGGDVAAR